jgi:hypothetical protein
VPSKAVRVIVLLTILAVVAIFGWGRSRTRAARVTWQRPVVVAVFLSGEAGEAEASALRASLEAIGTRLRLERDRHLGPASEPPFTFLLLGPLRPARPPPVAPPGSSLVDRALHAYDLWRAERAAFDAANGFDPALADIRIHLLASLPSRGTRSAEGLGAAGGEVGIVRASFDATDPFLAATTVVHEALHCVGATDKYDASGHAIAPGGLAEPDLAPLYPQRLAELMVGEIPLGPASGRLPAGPEELAVGPVTAAEIGWGAAASPAR